MHQSVMSSQEYLLVTFPCATRVISVHQEAEATGMSVTAHSQPGGDLQ